MYRVTTLCVSFVTSLSCPVMSPAAPSQAVHIPDSNHTCRVNFACRFLSIWLSSKIKVPHHRHHHNLSTLLLSPFSLWPPPPYQVASTDVMLRLSRKLVSHLNKYSPKRHFCINFIKALIQLLRGTSLDIAKLVPPTWSSPWARIEPSVLGGHHLGVIIKSAIIIIIKRFAGVCLYNYRKDLHRGGQRVGNLGRQCFHYFCSGVMTKNLFQIIKTVSNNRNCFK